MKKFPSYIDWSERKILLKTIDVVVVFLGIWIVSTIFLNAYIDIKSALLYQWYLLLAIYIWFFGQVFELYDLGVSNNNYLVLRSIFLTTFSTTILYVLTPFFPPVLPESRIQILYFFLAIAIPLTIWRFAYIFLLSSHKYFKNIVLIGNSSKIEKLLVYIKEKSLHHVVGYISDKKLNNNITYFDIKTTELVPFFSKQHKYVNEVIFSNKELPKYISNSIEKQLIKLYEKGIPIKTFEKYFEELTDRISESALNEQLYTTLNLSKNNTNTFYLLITGIINTIISFVGLFFLIVILPFVLIGNSIGNRGPLFYKQKRVGKNGAVFNIYKLRTMFIDAENNGAVWAIKKDSRVTKFGKFLRVTRLDEVPQFFNILKGEMSLIGPRPERPKFVSQLSKEIPYYSIRNLIKPGLTGWAQVNYPYASKLKDQEIKLCYDLFYIKERNLFLDFKICIKTISTILFFKGQ